MRDRIKELEYFNNFINEDLARINKFKDKLERGEVKQERVFAVKAKMHDLKLGILIAKYSRGDDILTLKEDYLKLVDDWEEVWEAEYYNKILKMLSLAVLFAIEKTSVDKIKNLLEKSNIDDWLLAFLINSFSGEQTEENKNLLFCEAFYTLKKVVYKDNKIELLKEYLCKEWYNKDCGCYEAHKSKQNIYYGYWSFEAGAIAKILNIDDRNLTDAPYYPYDLVHYIK
ncbi:MAG: DUF1911 domain-containing protein [Acetatifactor sp.]|nr:DUF1911 domain-containing protein [Acetatifactor sp.]